MKHEDLIAKWQRLSRKRKRSRNKWILLSVFLPLILVSFQNCEPTSVKIQKATAVAHD